MNNAMGLNLQSTASVDVRPSIPNLQAIVQNSENGDGLKQGEGGFFSILNSELEALVKLESVDTETLVSLQALENIGEVDELGELAKFSVDVELEAIVEPDVLAELDTPEFELSDLLLLEQEPNESLALIEPILMPQDDVSELNDELNDELGVLFQQALLELPKTITSLPLTSENKLFIQQQALALVEQKQPKLIEKLQQDGQEFPPQGTLLPLIEETLAKNDSAELIKLAPATAQNLSAKELSMMASTKDSSLNVLEDMEQTEDTELNFKNMFAKSESSTDGSSPEESSNKQLLTEIINKSAQSDESSSRPKFSTEVVSTLSNNILGANQAPINTPTATAVLSGTTLQLPQNPSPQQWGSALGDKVQWMINTKMESAEIRIDPPHLGKMDISIKMTDDGAQVVIQTQLAATRDLIDAASYRLKEMLEQAGHEQVNVDVSHKESSQSDSQFSQNDEHGSSQNSEKLENTINQDINNDVIAGTFNGDRPVLDLFV